MSGSGYQPQATHVDGLQYQRAYQYIFENPKWMQNLLLVAVANIIPVVGPLLLLGYQFEVVEALHRSPGRTYPDFDFNRFTDYLMRGLWPFLVSLILSFVMVPFAIILVVCAFGMLSLMAGSGDPNPIVVIMFLMMLATCWIVFFTAVNLVAMPMILRAGLSQDFGMAFNMAWVKDFFRRVWLELILKSLFMMASAMVLGMLGMMVFCVGVYAAVALIVMAQTHMYHQVYELYLSRGGDPIPLKQGAAIP